VGATNLPWDLDEAVLRRMVKRIYVPLPEAESRASLIRHLLSKQGPAGQHMSASQLNAIVSMTEGYSGSDLSAVCQEAALGPIREIAIDRLKTVKADEVRPIQPQDFGAALRMIRPSVSPDSLEQFRKWSDQFGITSR
jgi:spastin